MLEGHFRAPTNHAFSSSKLISVCTLYQNFSIIIPKATCLFIASYYCLDVCRHVVIREWARGQLTQQICVRVECLESCWTKTGTSCTFLCYAQDLLVNWSQKNEEKQNSQKCTMDSSCRDEPIQHIWLVFCLYMIFFVSNLFRYIQNLCTN